jgi:DNA invertase Pin-like site-specific DNA recombinase
MYINIAICYVVFGLVAEFERNLISARTKDALARVKAGGKKTGPPEGEPEFDAEAGDGWREAA